MGNIVVKLPNYLMNYARCQQAVLYTVTAIPKLVQTKLDYKGRSAWVDILFLLYLCIPLN